jgi:hypothetical protein
MIERVDRGARANSAVGTDYSACNEAIFVHADVFAGDDIGTHLGVPVEKQRSADSRFYDSRTRI